METCGGWVVIVLVVVAISGMITRSKFSLTCRRCGKLAGPIGGTRNRYRCDGCGKQFAGANHTL